MTLSARLLISAFALLAAACGSPSTGTDAGSDAGTAAGGDGGSSNAALTAFCAQYSTDLATAAHDCLGGPAELWRGSNPCGEAIAGVGRGRFTFNPDKVAGCHAAFSGPRLCAEVRDGAGPVSDACALVFTGAVATGGACAAAVDCAGAHVRCDTSATCPGVCKDVSVPGGSCAGPDDCTSNFCDNGTCGPPTVSAVASLGQSCAGNFVCDRGLACDTGTQLCRPLIREGASCTVGEGKCELFTTCVGGVCTRWGQLGAACDTSGSEYRGCIGAGLGCGAAMTCVALKPDGSSCTLAGECANHGCTNGACAGAPCLESK